MNRPEPATTWRRKRDERGASAVEYGLLVAAIAAVVIIILMSLGGLVRDMFSGTCSSIDSHASTVSASCAP